MAKILDHNHHLRKGTVMYPSLLIDDDYPELIPVALNTLKGGGSLPVIVYDGNGSMVELGVKVAASPLEIEKILRLYPVIFLVSEELSIKADSIIDLIERDEIVWTGC